MRTEPRGPDEVGGGQGQKKETQGEVPSAGPGKGREDTGGQEEAAGGRREEGEESGGPATTDMVRSRPYVAMVRPWKGEVGGTG